MVVFMLKNINLALFIWFFRRNVRTFAAGFPINAFIIRRESLRGARSKHSGWESCREAVPEQYEPKANYMKHVTWIFVLSVGVSLFSFVGKDIVPTGLSVGDAAPDFSVENRSGKQENILENCRGSYVVLSFWAGYDAPSRMQNAWLGHAVEETSVPIRMISVSFDRYESIFSETVRKDGLDTAHCFIEPSGESSRLYQKYHLDKGFRSFLLDKEGRILARNITADKLPQYLR